MQDIANRNITPEAVARFAWLHMSLDDGSDLLPADHHMLWLKLICNSDLKRILIIAPPESAKTTWSIAYLAASIAFDCELPRIIAAVTETVAEKRATSVRNVCTSDEFVRNFPNIRRAISLKWTASEWSLAPEGVPRPGRVHPTMMATGVGGTIISTRAYELLADDLLDLDSTRTQLQRDKTDTWVHAEMLSRVMSRIGRTIVIGTSWHHDDSYSRIKANYNNWTVCHLPLLSEGPDVRALVTYPDTYTGPKLGEPITEASARDMSSDLDGINTAYIG